MLVLDAQATAAHPSRGALVEVGWARWSAAEPGELAASRVTAHVVASPAGGGWLSAGADGLTGEKDSSDEGGGGNCVGWVGPTSGGSVGCLDPGIIRTLPSLRFSCRSRR